MAAPQSSRPRSKAPLFAVITVAVVALAWFAFTALRRPGSPTTGPKIPNDPIQGAAAKLPKLDLAGAPVKPGGNGPILLVALPGCSGCTKDEFDPEKINMGKFDRVILLSSGRVLLTKLSGEYKDLHIEFVPDSNDQAANALNAVFKPRGYILNPDFTVRATQGSKQTLADFANSAD